jgi:aspartokinase-like uncharacterized kinase
MCTILYKLGGSLLSQPDLVPRLRAVLEQPVSFDSSWPGTELVKPLIVVGGGPVADAVRDWDKIHQLGDERAHDLALRSMSFNAHLITALLQNARVVASRAEADRAWLDGKIAVLDATAFVDHEEQVTGNLLPRSWDITSDSIAASVALRWPAAALVFLKSVALPAELDLPTAAKQGLVDPYLPNLAARLCPIGWANLRSDKPRIQQWLAPATE